MKHNFFEKIALKIRDDKKLQSMLYTATFIIVYLISIDKKKDILDVILLFLILFGYGFYFKTITNQRFSIFRVILVVISVILLTIAVICLSSWIIYSLID